jgi:hypothetical protein
MQSAQWSTALTQGVTAVRTYGGADVGMRTLLDALVPAVAALATHKDNTSLAEVWHDSLVFVYFSVVVVL